MFLERFLQPVVSRQTYLFYCTYLCSKVYGNHYLKSLHLVNAARAKLLEEYSKAIDSLTIYEENRLRKKVQELTLRFDQMARVQRLRFTTQETDLLNELTFRRDS